MVVKRTIRIGSRSSRLALAQTTEAIAAMRAVLPADTDIATSTFETPGDRDRHTPLSEPGIPDDFFTRDLDEALLQNRIDLAVHSAKDLPRNLPKGLAVAALLPGRDPRDALAIRPGREGPPRVIGTSGAGREQAVRELFPEATAKPLRGTIDERLERLDRGEYDAIIVAACALERLGLGERISQYLPYQPAPLQGRLALSAREEDEYLLAILKPLDFRLGLFRDLPEPDAPDIEWMKRQPQPAMLFVGTNPQRFAHLGSYIHWPVIRLVPRPLDERLTTIRQLSCEDMGIVFASPFAVRVFTDTLFHWRDARAINGRKLFAVGPSTALELEKMGFHPSFSIADYSGSDGAGNVPAAARGRYFYPCSDLTPLREREMTLHAGGIDMVPAIFYENRRIPPRPLPPVEFDRVLFTSPSTVDAYFTSYPDEESKPRTWLAIGPTTLHSLESRNLKGTLFNEVDLSPSRLRA